MVSSSKRGTKLYIDNSLKVSFPNNVNDSRETRATSKILDNLVNQNLVDCLDIFWRQLTRMLNPYRPIRFLSANKDLCFALNIGFCGGHSENSLK